MILNIAIFHEVNVYHFAHIFLYRVYKNRFKWPILNCPFFIRFRSDRFNRFFCCISINWLWKEKGENEAKKLVWKQDNMGKSNMRNWHIQNRQGKFTNVKISILLPNDVSDAFCLALNVSNKLIYIVLLNLNDENYDTSNQVRSQMFRFSRINLIALDY